MAETKGRERQRSGREGHTSLSPQSPGTYTTNMWTEKGSHLGLLY